jgi:predicted esterase YcpF (UPF0227 family)
MAEAAKGINPNITPEVTEEVKAMATEVKEEVIEAPSRLRQQLHRFAVVWERVSVRSSVSESYGVVGSGLGGMYGAKFRALAREHEQVKPRE